MKPMTICQSELLEICSENLELKSQLAGARSIWIRNGFVKCTIGRFEQGSSCSKLAGDNRNKMSLLKHKNGEVNRWLK